MDIQKKYKLFKDGQTIVDLGAAPGGWSAEIAPLVHATEGSDGKVIALDLLDIEPIKHALILKGDFTQETTQKLLLQHLTQDALDGVVSDMAPSCMGHKETDHLRQINLARKAFVFAQDTLKPSGFFVTKFFQGSQEVTFLKDLRLVFEDVYIFKPKSSRDRSREMYAVCKGFKG